MGAVRMRAKQLIEKNHNNPPVIHTTPVHQLTSCEVKSCVFGRNKSIINALKHYFHLKYKSSVHNIAFSSELSPESEDKYAQIKHSL